MQTHTQWRWLLVALAFAPALRGEAPRSLAFTAAMNQLSQWYLAPNGMLLADLEKTSPSNLAILMGAVLRAQAPHVRKDPRLREPFLELQKELRAYLDEVAARAGGADQGGGQCVDADALWSTAMSAAKGSHDEYVRGQWGRTPDPAPLILASRPSQPEDPEVGVAADQPSGPSSPEGTRGRLLHDEEQEIILIGQPVTQPAPPPQPADNRVARAIALYNAGVDAWNASLQLWQAGSFAASKMKCQEAQAAFTQVKQLSASMIGGMSCWFVDPDPREATPDWSQCGPFLTPSPVSRRTRTPLRHWQE